MHVTPITKSPQLMGKNKVLVKVHPEGKYVVDIDKVRKAKGWRGGVGAGGRLEREGRGRKTKVEGRAAPHGSTHGMTRAGPGAAHGLAGASRPMPPAPRLSPHPQPPCPLPPAPPHPLHLPTGHLH